MSYRVTICSTTVEMDSANEVYDLLSKSSHSGSPSSLEARVVRNQWDEDKATRLFRCLPKGSFQSRVIRTLYRGKEDGLSREELLKELDISDAQQVGGAFSGLSKNAKKLGLASPVEIEKARDQSGRRTYLYRLNASLRKIIEIADQKKKATTERELPELREYIRTRRAALAGFMEQGASLVLNGDLLTVTPRNEIYIRYLNDNRKILAEYASEFYERPITVKLNPLDGTPTPKTTNGAPVPKQLQ